MSKTALPGAKRLNAFAMEPDALTIVGLDTDDGPEHPLYDERCRMPLDEGLVTSIAREEKLLQAVGVRKNGHLIEVVHGRQRVRALRVVNERRIKDGLPPLTATCFVERPISDVRAMGMMIAENENRVNDDPVTRATKAARFIAMGATENDVSVSFGISRQAVKNLLALLELSDEVKKAVQLGHLSYSAAIELRDLPRTQQDSKLAAMLEVGATGVSEAKRQRRARANGKSATPRGRAVGIKTLRRIADNEEFTSELSPDARALLRWILGDESAAAQVKGLATLLGQNNGQAREEKVSTRP